MGKITPKQHKFMLHMLTNDTVEGAAKEAGIARSTAYNYMRDPTFKAEQRNLMRGLLSTVTARLQYEATASVNTLAEIRDDKNAPPYSRVEASKILLEMAYKSFEIEDIQARMERIEEALEQQEKK